MVKTVSYQEVLKAVEEAALLPRQVYMEGGKDFAEKARVLDAFGLGNSIACKMYKEVAENGELCQYYAQHYPHAKFLLESQLMLICEDFNLYVRPTRFFMGNIPEKNVRDLMNFRFYLKDLEGIIEVANVPIDESALRNLNAITWQKLEDLRTSREIQVFNLPLFTSRYISIAAVKELFNERAFGEHFGNARLPKTAELPPKAQVDSDPLVLLKVRGGYLVITAWGPEANHELAINPKMN